MAENKTDFLRVRFTPDQVAALKAIAARDQCSVSEWVRQVVDRRLATGDARAILAHLDQRCGSCRHWGTQYELGTGYCELPKTPDTPMRASDYGGITTRIDFGCLWWTPAEPVAREEAPSHA